MLLTVQLHADEMKDYDPTPAIADWAAPKQRRVGVLKPVQSMEQYDAASEMPDMIVTDDQDQPTTANKEFDSDDCFDICGADSDYGSDFEELQNVCRDLSDCDSDLNED